MSAAVEGRLSPNFEDDEILDALHWCRLGRVRPKRDDAFHEAKRLGLLAQDPVWRATMAGELLLAQRRPDAYGKRAASITCARCGAAPLQPCAGRVRDGGYREFHAVRQAALARSEGER